MTLEVESLHVSRDLVKGATTGLGAYIKPGGIHRLTLSRVYDEILCNLLSSIDSIAGSYELGVKIKKGETSLANIDIGKTLANTLKEAFRNCNTCHPQYIVPLQVGAIGIGLSGVESILKESAKFKKALELLNSVSKWSSIKQFIETLKLVKRDDMYEHLSNVGFTQIGLLQSNVTFNDVYRSLGSKWRGFLIVESRDALIFTYLKRLDELHKKYRDLSISIVALYMDIIKPHIPANLSGLASSAESCNYMATPDCTKLMLELDVALRRGHYSFEWASELVTLTSAFASFEGLK